MKTSARNHLFGTVIRIDQGPVNDEITVLLDGSGAHMYALVTRAMVNVLDLEVGSKVVILIKTHDVMLITDYADVIFSAHNQLSGTILSITESTVSADVRVRLDGGGTIAAVITMESVRDMGLSPGTPVTVMVRASNVIVGVQKKSGAAH